jgi:hypothetical protein
MSVAWSLYPTIESVTDLMWMTYDDREYPSHRGSFYSPSRPAATLRLMGLLEEKNHWKVLTKLWAVVTRFEKEVYDMNVGLQLKDEGYGVPREHRVEKWAPYFAMVREELAAAHRALAR